ncbi:MAG TPA: Na/Pi symporter [Chryseosolibacter sp.]|nr:Na/Pi symporter [Chryseosolibacter sp.]
MEEETGSAAKTSKVDTRSFIFITGAFLLFFFALELMITSFDALGAETIHTVLSATSNPFTGLFIGLLITAIIQSSSTTTALVVTLVGSGTLTLLNAVPVIMGANLGTTITALIVSLGFLNKPKEFKRAVSAAAYHSFFNLLTIIVLFPLEYKYALVTRAVTLISDYLFLSVGGNSTEIVSWSVFGFVIDPLVTVLDAPIVLVSISFILLFASILFFRRQISNLLIGKSPDSSGRFIFEDPLKSLGWGLITTAAIRSSTITTSLVVPLVAKKIIKLREAASFIMGANVGTTVTAFIAVLVSSNSVAAISIALAHLLFNVAGILLFFVMPFLPAIPYELSKHLGIVSARYRISIVLFVLFTFFIIPFTLIYISNN